MSSASVCARDAADVGERLPPERADRAGHGRHALQDVVEAPVEVEAHDVLDVLPAAEEAAAVADLRVARDGADVRRPEGLDELPERLGLEDRVRVDHDDDVVPGLRDAVVQRGGLAGVRLAQDASPAAARGRSTSLRGAVGRAVVDDDDLELGVVARGQRAHRALDADGLVEGRDDDRDRRRERLASSGRPRTSRT